MKSLFYLSTQVKQAWKNIRFPASLARQNFPPEWQISLIFLSKSQNFPTRNFTSSRFFPAVRDKKLPYACRSVKCSDFNCCSHRISLEKNITASYCPTLCMQLSECSDIFYFTNVSRCHMWKMLLGLMYLSNR